MAGDRAVLPEGLFILLVFFVEFLEEIVVPNLPLILTLLERDLFEVVVLFLLHGGPGLLFDDFLFDRAELADELLKFFLQLHVVLLTKLETLFKVHPMNLIIV